MLRFVFFAFACALVFPALKLCGRRLANHGIELDILIYSFFFFIFFFKQLFIIIICTWFVFCVCFLCVFSIYSAEYVFLCSITSQWGSGLIVEWLRQWWWWCWWYWRCWWYGMVREKGELWNVKCECECECGESDTGLGIWLEKKCPN